MPTPRRLQYFHGVLRALYNSIIALSAISDTCVSHYVSQGPYAICQSCMLGIDT